MLILAYDKMVQLFWVNIRRGFTKPFKQIVTGVVLLVRNGEKWIPLLISCHFGVKYKW